MSHKSDLEQKTGYKCNSEYLSNGKKSSFIITFYNVHLQFYVYNEKTNIFVTRFCDSHKEVLTGSRIDI